MVDAVTKQAKRPGIEEQAPETASPPSRHRTYSGQLIDHGAAPDPHVRGRRLSYYVVVETSRGRETLWDDALHAAIHRSRAQTRDRVTVLDKGDSRSGQDGRRRVGRDPNRWLITRDRSPVEIESYGLPTDWRIAPERVNGLLHALAPRIAHRVFSQDTDRRLFEAIVGGATTRGSADADKSTPQGLARYVDEELRRRAAQLRQEPRRFRVDDVHLRDIHSALFRGLADHHGTFRTGNMVEALEGVLGPVRSRDIGKLSTFDSARVLADAFREILVLRPFDYGNLPTAGVFVEDLAQSRGHALGLYAIRPRVLHASLQKAVTQGDVRDLARLLSDHLQVADVSISNEPSARVHQLMVGSIGMELRGKPNASATIQVPDSLPASRRWAHDR